MIITLDWPGASADQMMRDVADPVERKLQELTWLAYTASDSKSGEVTVLVSLKDTTPLAVVPAIWYQVRKKVGDIVPAFPQGAAPPIFNDEFGDLFGIVYAFASDGFTLPELRHVLEDVCENLLSILYGSPCASDPVGGGRDSGSYSADHVGILGPMAITIMGGLVSAPLLTLGFIPALYSA